jgi:hypothetical protein
MYIKEGYNGHSLELMSPSGSEVDSKKPTHPRVDWKAPPPATEIGAPFASDDVGHIGLIGLPGSTVRGFRQKFTVEDAIGFHAFAPLEASRRETNDIPLGCPLFLPVHTVNCVQTLKALARIVPNDLLPINLQTDHCTTRTKSKHRITLDNYSRSRRRRRSSNSSSSSNSRHDWKDSTTINPPHCRCRRNNMSDPYQSLD